MKIKANWQLIPIEVKTQKESNEGITCILPDKNDPHTFFLCNKQGILKTTDNGRSYRNVRER